MFRQLKQPTLYLALYLHNIQPVQLYTARDKLIKFREYIVRFYADSMDRVLGQIESAHRNVQQMEQHGAVFTAVKSYSYPVEGVLVDGEGDVGEASLDYTPEVGAAVGRVIS